MKSVRTNVSDVISTAKNQLDKEQDINPTLKSAMQDVFNNCRITT